MQQLHVAAWRRDVSTDVSSVQFAVLSVLDRRPGSSQAELGNELDLDRSTIADLVGRMVGRGLLTRTTDDIDQRRRVLALTAAGEAMVTELQPRVAALEEVLLAGLRDAERAELRRLLRIALTAAESSGLLVGVTGASRER